MGLVIWAHMISGCSLPALTEDNTTIDASDNHIGGDGEGQRNVFLTGKYGVQIAWGDQNVIGSGNVIAENSDHGVYVYHANDNLIYGNYIGYPFVIGSGGNDGDGGT